MKPSELAQKAYDLIKDKSGWCQGSLATDGFETVHWTSWAATCFCSVGAVCRAGKNSPEPVDFKTHQEVYFSLIDNLPEGFEEVSSAIVKYNDGNSHEEVCQWWEKAISDLKSRGM